VSTSLLCSCDQLVAGYACQVVLRGRSPRPGPACGNRFYVVREILFSLLDTAWFPPKETGDPDHLQLESPEERLDRFRELGGTQPPGFLSHIFPLQFVTAA